MERHIFTIGHSTHPIKEFLELLKAFKIDVVSDVRSIPKSRHNPQFNSVDLENSLKTTGMEYVHMSGLGGLRHTSKNSVNTAWQNTSFRGYADYMQTSDFKNNLGKLADLARQRVVVIMCSEALPWRCHRSLISDALLVHGFAVEHIMSRRITKPHQMTPWAKVEGDTITYPGNH